MSEHLAAQAPDSQAMPRVELSNAQSAATIFHHGAHLTNWTPAGAAPVLWVSKRSQWRADKAIRGGVPLCFPWFGPHPSDKDAPAHGWARVSQWKLEIQTGEMACFTSLHEDWALRYTVRAARELELELEMENRANHTRRCEAALHTYFAVEDVRQTIIRGLQGAPFVDKTRGGARKVQPETDLEIIGETDRVYFSEASVEIHDRAAARTIVIEKSGAGATVVWNPWIAKAAAMPDFGDDEWTQMLCVETANALDCALEIAPGAAHTLKAIIRVE